MNKNSNSKEKSEERCEGYLEKITFQDPSTGFMVGRLREAKSSKAIIFSGKVYNVSEGENLILSGYWQVHPTYGYQFKAISFTIVEPQSVLGIEKYLTSGRFKNIGPKTAEQIVKKFGADTLKVIDETPEKLLSLSLVNKSKISALKEGRSKLKGEEDVYVFLHNLQLSRSLISKIFDYYGLETIPIIKENPYRLAHEIRGIGFRIADTIAAQQKIPKNSPQRAQAALLYFLDQLSQSGGHTCYSKRPLIRHVLQELAEEQEEEKLTEELLLQAVDQLIVSGLLCQETEEELLFLNYYLKAEQHIAGLLHNLITNRQYHRLTFSETELEKLEIESQITLHFLQKKAIREIMEQKVILLTGGPGTGKTTIVNFLLKLIGKSGMNIALAAPTGKAAKRLAETTGWEVKTIHRHLEFTGRGPGRGKENPMDCDFLLLDECSMIDVTLFRHLLNALPPTSRLVMIGDADQLPSIGPGAILRDLLRFPRISSIRLQQVFRQGDSSLISLQAHRIIQGQEIEDASLNEDIPASAQDFHFIAIPKQKTMIAGREEYKTNHDRLLHNLLLLFLERIPKQYQIPSEEIQILSPTRVGALGTENLNRIIRESLFSHLQPMQFGNRIYYLGDRVMQTKNDYDREVFNGDQGVVIKGTKNTLTVNFDGRDVLYEERDLDNLLPAWAITIHKSQGSEFPGVIIILTGQHHIMLQRNLLYTAVTRGKKLVIILGEKSALNKAIRNESIIQRHTFLLERLHQKFTAKN